MNLIKALLSHQYDSVKQESIMDCVLTEENSLKLQAINTLLEKENLMILICSDDDHSHNVSIDESTLKSLFVIDTTIQDFIPFHSSIADALYTHMCNDNLNKVLMVKLKSGDIITCDLKWEQGNGNNYYFYNEYLGVRISIDSVVGYKFI